MGSETREWGDQSMGFQSADTFDFARGLMKRDGVTGVWILAPDDRHATLWIAVQGFDDQAYERRLQVRDVVEDFLSQHQGAMQASAFVFDYYVVVDEPGLGDAQIPAGALSLAAA